MPQWTMLDTGLLAAITQNGQYKKYLSFVKGLNSLEMDISHCQMIVTPFSLLEAIGVRMPQVSNFRPNMKTLAEIEAADLRGENVAGAIEEVRAGALRHYEERFAVAPDLQKDFLNQKLAKRLEYVDPHLQVWFGDIFGKNIETQEQVEIIWNRLALDRLYAHPFRGGMRPLMDAAAMVDVVRSFEFELNVSQVRALKYGWEGFTKTLDKAIEDGEFEPSDGVTLGQIRSNIDKVSTLFDFKGTRDLCDIDNVQRVVTGHLQDGTLRPVFCFTADPIEKTRVRIQTLKSLMVNIHEMAATARQGVEEGSLHFQAGHVAFFDQHGKLLERLDVNQEKSIFERLGTEVM